MLPSLFSHAALQDFIRRAYRFEAPNDSEPVRQRLAALCDAAQVDYAYVDNGKRFSHFRLLAMDMDSTLITIECIDEIADYAGKKAQVSAVTAAAMRGEITDFAESLKKRAALLAGVNSDTFRRVFEERLTLSPGAAELIVAARHYDIFTLLLSGGFDYFADRLKAQLGIDAAFANHLEVIEGNLTGELRIPILDSKSKAQYVRDHIRRLRCDPSDVCVIGDGANDIPMMAESPYSVAYHAKPKTVAAARFAIKYGPLTTLLDYFLG